MNRPISIARDPFVRKCKDEYTEQPLISKINKMCLLNMNKNIIVQFIHNLDVSMKIMLQFILEKI